jgi:diaminopimelate dehydrogenase
MVRSWCENNVAPVVEAVDEAIALLSAARDELVGEGTAAALSEAGFQAHGRYRARSGTRVLDGGVKLSHRPVIRVSPGAGDQVAVISTGWDPGFFSLNRVYGAAVLPGADQMTFWGPGLSQGHSDAVRRVPGVKKGVQYTKPNPDAIAAVKRGEGGDLDAKKCHIRHCYIVADEADQDAIREAIVTMPDYFVGYETIVDFISDEEFERDHQGMPHGGNVVTQGRAGTSRHVIEFGLELERNPDFTAAVQVAYGRAAHRLREAGERGARTVLEIAPYLLSQTPLDELIKNDV